MPVSMSQTFTSRRHSSSLDPMPISSTFTGHSVFCKTHGVQLRRPTKQNFQNESSPARLKSCIPREEGSSHSAAWSGWDELLHHLTVVQVRDVPNIRRDEPIGEAIHLSTSAEKNADAIMKHCDDTNVIKLSSSLWNIDSTRPNMSLENGGFWPKTLRHHTKPLKAEDLDKGPKG